ncbi:MAG TPA: hypothetical protein PLP17_17490, partial [Oligoflexia bacterium]|nr:hypothetical protein [Oligoflexia bacterium]
IVDQYADNRIGYHAPRLWPWTEITGNLVPPYFFEFVNTPPVRRDSANITLSASARSSRPQMSAISSL